VSVRANDGAVLLDILGGRPYPGLMLGAIDTEFRARVGGSVGFTYERVYQELKKLVRLGMVQRPIHGHYMVGGAQTPTKCPTCRGLGVVVKA
jgi:hypothetical protein